MASFNFDQYFSFSVPDYAGSDIQGLDNLVTASIGELAPEDKSAIFNALQEIANTPEGQDLILRAAAAAGGKINLFAHAGFTVVPANHGDIVFGDKDIDAKYIGVDGQRHEFSIKRLLVHELNHLALNHHNRDLDVPYSETLRIEAQAIAATNAYMSKYENEVPRVTDGSDRIFEALKPEKFETIPENVAETMSPELRSLYELRGNEDSFYQQMRDIDPDVLGDVEEELNVILNAIEGPEEVIPQENPHSVAPVHTMGPPAGTP